MVKMWGSLESVSSLVIYRMRLNYDFLRQFKYYLSYLRQYSFMVAAVARYFLLSLKRSQSLRLNQFALLSDKFLMSLCRCL